MIANLVVITFAVVLAIKVLAWVLGPALPLLAFLAVMALVAKVVIHGRRT